MTLKKIQNHENAQARFIYDDNGYLRGLKSYSTTVITVDSDGWMTVHGLYSRTTIKHIGWFMAAFGLSYYHAKDCYTDNIQMNLYTGEVREAI